MSGGEEWSLDQGKWKSRPGVGSRLINVTAMRIA